MTSHHRSRIVDFASSAKLDPENLSRFHTDGPALCVAKGSGEEKPVELCEGDNNGCTHKEVTHQAVCIKRSFKFDKVLEATVKSSSDRLEHLACTVVMKMVVVGNRLT